MLKAPDVQLASSASRQTGGHIPAHQKLGASNISHRTIVGRITPLAYGLCLDKAQGIRQIHPWVLLCTRIHVVIRDDRDRIQNRAQRWARDRPRPNHMEKELVAAASGRPRPRCLKAQEEDTLTLVRYATVTMSVQKPPRHIITCSFQRLHDHLQNVSVSADQASDVFQQNQSGQVLSDVLQYRQYYNPAALRIPLSVPFPPMENGWQGKPESSRSQSGASSLNASDSQSSQLGTSPKFLRRNARCARPFSHQNTLWNFQGRCGKAQLSVHMPEQMLPTLTLYGKTWCTVGRPKESHKGSKRPTGPPLAGPGRSSSLAT